jgi:hypothetical protein
MVKKCESDALVKIIGRDVARHIGRVGDDREAANVVGITE